MVTKKNRARARDRRDGRTARREDGDGKPMRRRSFAGFGEVRRSSAEALQLGIIDRKIEVIFCGFEPGPSGGFRSLLTIISS